MYGVFFKSADLVFVDPEEFSTPEMKGWKADFEASGALAEASRDVALDGAPLASWVLARLAAMSESTLFPNDAIRRDGELGGFRLRMLAVRGVEPIARLRFVAECGAAELIARGPDAEKAESTARGFIAALMADPKDLGRCRVAAKAAELGGHRNEYGFDGIALLGRHNRYD